MRRPTLKKLAEQSGCSESTLYRVLREAANVKPATREAVVRLLNIHGYMVQNSGKIEKVGMSPSTIFIPNGLPGMSSNAFSWRITTRS